MRTTTLLATFAIALMFADSVEAQRGGGRGGRNRWRRSEEITNRVGVFFSPTAGPAVDGDKVADLNTIELVRAAAAANQVTVLYLHDGGAPDEAVKDFERRLFPSDQSGDELGIKLSCFHCGSIDISKVPALKTRFGEDAPLFIAFDKSGKELKPVSMAGFKPNSRALESLLDKAGKGAFKPALTAFAKKYGKMIEDLEKVLKEKGVTALEMAKAGKDKAKKKKAEKEHAALQDEEQKLLDKEKSLLDKQRMPQRGSKRLGGRRPGRNERGNTGEGNTGKGNTGKGNTGKGNTGRGNSGG